MDAAHYLGVYDLDVIYSWTPRQFHNLVKGSHLRKVDDYELAAAGALFTAKASNSKKKIKQKDIFDADKARKKIENHKIGKGKADEASNLNLERYRKAQEAMKQYSIGKRR